VLGTMKKILENLSIVTSDKKLDLKEQINFQQNLEFKNISFKYPGTENLVINNFNFLLKKNKKIGIFGPSGSGKNYIFRFINWSFKLLKMELYWLTVYRQI
jgi:ABC-type multidrug transport system fused ATPase/permease subunit